jgi:protein tyrosine/serine phosphatase
MSENMAVIGEAHELGGLYNVRDIGGYPTADGGVVRRGMLFRASSLHRLEDELAWARFGAGTVIDLRYDRERLAFPLPAFITGELHSPFLPNDWDADPATRSLPAAEFLASVFRDMVDVGGDTVRKVLARLAVDDAYPAVFFCMAGKDRTGVLAAVLLALLGVSDEDIMADFELSGDEVVALVDHLRTREDFEDHPMMNQAEEVLRAPRAAMEIFLADVGKEFGGIPGWVRELGVSDEAVEVFRTRLVAPSNISKEHP